MKYILCTIPASVAHLRLRLVLGLYISCVLCVDAEMWDHPCVTFCAPFATTHGIGVEETGRLSANVMTEEQLKVQPIEIPFLQEQGDWRRRGKGISMGSNGEPKSGTTWAERIITELAIQLCGSPTNTWCEMGGLKVFPHRPASSYAWEMLHADTGELYLHFDGRSKHKITGFDVGDGCNTRGSVHPDSFGNHPPCRNANETPTRQSLLRCMPDMSERCAELMPPRDPADLRTAVLFRDPRDVVISEHRMRIEVYNWTDTPEITPFIYERFETIASWQYVRWMWYTTFYENASHVMFYEDIQTNPVALADVAGFMGLNFTLEQVRHVQDIHRNRSPHGNYDTFKLPVEAIKYMNATMSKILPLKMLTRYGLSSNQ